MSSVTANEVSVWRTDHRYNLRYQNDFLLPNFNGVHHDKNSPLYLGQSFAPLFLIDSNTGVSIIVLKSQS